MIFPIVNHCYFEPMSRGEPHSPDVNHILTIFKKYFMASFYGWGSTASRLEPIWGGNLLFPNKFPKVPGTQFINVRRIKVFDGRRISGPLSHPVVLNTGPLDWESSTLTTRPLLHLSLGYCSMLSLGHCSTNYFLSVLYHCENVCWFFLHQILF